MAPANPRFTRTALYSALAASWLCSLPAIADENAPAAEPTKAELAAELASRLLACSYDGSPIRFSPLDLSTGAESDGVKIVAEIMKYTGLPQNFDVVVGDIPNAAAVIALGPDKVPRRVIAYNPEFMGVVQKATTNNDWSPVSIMAHEIGHHLSGHTLMPGGSQPPIELEADTFSGFVLYKMGASLPDALRAVKTLVPVADGDTHPGRPKRVAAIEQGWQQACSQQSGDCVGESGHASKPVAAVAAPTLNRSAPTAGPPVVKTTPSAELEPQPGPPAAGPILSATAKPDSIPAPSTERIPSKFDRFVMDETGAFDPGEKARLAQTMYDFAKEKDVEVVTLIVKDLHGLPPDDYAYAMMRQLRVGKMDVGNGAVLVVAPNQKQVGAALGSGLHLEIDDESLRDLVKGRMMGFIEQGLAARKGNAPVSPDWSRSVSEAADYIRDSAKNWDWTIRYPMFKDFERAVADEAVAIQSGDYDPETSPAWRKITRVQGTLNSLNGPKDYAQEGEAFKQMLAERAPKGGYTTEIKTPDGRVLIAFVDAHTQQMMTTKLTEGRPFNFTLRAESPQDYVFNVLSYDAL